MTQTQKTLLAAGIVLLLVGLAASFSAPLLPSGGESIATCVIVYESADNTVANAKVEAAVHAWCKQHGVAYRLVDPQDQDQTGKTPADEVPWLAKAKGKTWPYWILAGPKGSVVREATLPKTDTEALTILAKYVGGK